MDKINILWIEDDAKGATRLSDQYEKYFEIVLKNKKGFSKTIKSINQYRTAIKGFKENSEEYANIFPVELLFADYDLSSYSPRNEKSEDKDHTNFSGFLLQIIHALYFQQHPCGIVSATAKGEALDNMYPNFKKVNQFLNEEINANIDMSITNKDIDLLCDRGVEALRNNIQRLFNNGDIIISWKDIVILIELLQNDTNIIEDMEPVLTITSKYSCKSIPINGLFIDIKDEKKKREAIYNWLYGFYYNAYKMNDIYNAVRIARNIIDWSIENEELVENRSKLSEYCATLQEYYNQIDADMNLFDIYQSDSIKFNKDIINITGDDFDHEHFIKLAEDFKLKQKNKDIVIQSNVISILDESLNPDVFRLAILYFIADTINDHIIDNEKVLIDQYDVFHKMCPNPSTPVVFPEDRSKQQTISSAIRKIREIDLDISHILNGWDHIENSNERSKKGFNPGERFLLGTFILDRIFELDSELDYETIVRHSCLSKILGNNVNEIMINHVEKYLAHKVEFPKVN